MHKLIAYIVYGFVFSVMTIQVSVAEIVTIQFKGNVDFVNGVSSINSGDQVSGTYSFDTNTQNTSPISEFAEYRVNGPLPYNIGYQSLSIGNVSLTPNQDAWETAVFVADDVPSWDGLSQYMDNVAIIQCCPAGTLSNGLTVDGMSMDFSDSVNNPISSHDLKGALSNLASFSQKTMSLHGMDSSGYWYDIQIKITSVSLDGGNVAAPSNLVAFDSLITSINDPSGQLSPELRPGVVFDGYFTFDPSLPNMNPPGSQFAMYNSIGNEKNHMTLNLAGQNYKTDHLSDFNIQIENREPSESGPDIYEVDIPTSAIQLANGSRVNQINLRFINLTRQKLTSTELLASTPSDLTTWFRAYLEISGQHMDGSTFQIKSSLSALEPGSMTTTPMATEELFPASGVLSMRSMQEFPGAQILFDANRPLVEYVSNMLLNERGERRLYCSVQGLTWMTNQQNLVCPDVKYEVSPGLNVFRIYVRFADGSSKYYMTRWNVID